MFDDSIKVLPIIIQIYFIINRVIHKVITSDLPLSRDKTYQKK